MLRNSDKDKLGCGGTLISPSRVLTAAHCMIEDRWIPELGPPEYVRIGHTSREDGEVVPVECVSIHPNYVSRFYDVAIVKLARDATITTNFVTLNSNISYSVVMNAAQPLTALGFGSTSTWLGLLGTFLMLGRIPKSPSLQKLTTHFVSARSCRKDGYSCATSRYHICAQIDNAGVCFGDSGGPLLDENNLQVGVVSFKTGGFSCDNASPDVYMNVASYYDWIQAEMESSECTPYSGGLFESPCASANSKKPKRGQKWSDYLGF